MTRRQGSAESLLKESQKQTLVSLYTEQKLSVMKIAATTGVPATTVKRVLKSKGIRLTGSPYITDTKGTLHRG